MTSLSLGQRNTCGIVAAVICLIAAQALQAQPIFETRESIEWQAADSPVIVRASIADVKREQAEDRDYWDTVTLKVHETFKGKHRESITFLLENSNAGSADDTIMPAKGTDRQFLFFLVDSVTLAKTDKKYAKHSLALRNTRVSRYWSMIDLSGESPAWAVTLKLEVLSDPQEILRATKRAISQSAMANKLKPWNVAVPVNSPLYGQMVASVDVPIDFRLEQQARLWTSSPDKRVRRSAAASLSHFKSPANAAILRRLLVDPGYYEEEVFTGRRKIGVLREYDVRHEACLILKQWGEDFAEPVLKERILDRGK